uniref:histidine kinase n=1 Tax=Caulobacter sp. (strain K31) TaxID=366602 RepID=B0T8X2_CAUSK
MAAQDPPYPDPSLSLALAVVASSTAPLLLLDGDLTVVAASDSFCRSFHIPPDAAKGVEVFQLGKGEWNAKRLRSLLTATLSGGVVVEAYEMDLAAPIPGAEPRRLVLNAQKLAYGIDAPVRLLLAVADVTDARLAAKLKDDLLREKAVLLQEVHHRVANSLQIIASVILQSARKVQSDETRLYLHDAHNRVMSIAALQQQLAVSRRGAVALRGYFTQLCQSIGASMIHDQEKISLGVDVDDSAVEADVSVSLGLIVTELVINSLKHAFPDQRAGTITVGYRAHGPNWTLSISDDGIGIPTDVKVEPGLGTNIVEALGAQLKARVQVTSAHPGTIVSIIHNQIAMVAAEAQSAD